MTHIVLAVMAAGCALVLVAGLARAAHSAPRPSESEALMERPEHWVEGKGDQGWQWKWQVWLPDKWQRIGACETGYGRRPGQWDWNSGTYQGAFGFHHDSWDGFKPYSHYPNEAYLASPWQQYQTALAIYRRYGLSGWGCRHA